MRAIALTTAFVLVSACSSGGSKGGKQQQPGPETGHDAASEVTETYVFAQPDTWDAADAPAAPEMVETGPETAEPPADGDAADSAADADVCQQEAGCLPVICIAGQTQPCESSNEWGQCKGTQDCVDGTWSGCDAPPAAEETCDDADDDCDGMTDEGLDDEPCDGEPNEYGSCPGTTKCSGGVLKCSGPAAKPEVCNGLDDNCDGIKDNAQCDDLNPCTEESCAVVTGEWGCWSHPVAADCDDGNACTVGDSCSSGQCKAGAPLECDDLNPCTTDSCDPSAGCVAEPNALPCDDGDACTLGDACDEASCVPGPAMGCDDGNPCTDDSCDPAAGCQHQPNDDACDDGNACSVNQCAGGECVVLFNPCECDTDDDCASADDGDLCTGIVICEKSEGMAKCALDPASVVSCDGSVDTQCAQNLCDPATGECSLTPVSEGEPCDDESLCTTGEHCEDSECAGGDAPVCDDLNPCTQDACDPDSGCVQFPVGKPCDDGTVCTVGDSCVSGQCVPGKALDCDDGDPCSADICDPLAGCGHKCIPACVACANGADCDDADLCTTDYCVKGSSACEKVCLHTQVSCDDGVGCTLDDCSANAGCASTPDAFACDDSNPCTDDACHPVAGCQNVANAVSCSDGDACNGEEWCSGSQCQPGEALVCEDENVCTDDACDPIEGCVNAPNKVSCSDNDACNGLEACSGGQCVPGAAPECDDKNLCTDDWCDKAKGCAHASNAMKCGDSYCAGLEHYPAVWCSAGNCPKQAAQDCDDGDPCTEDFCSPGAGCTHEDMPDGASCSAPNTCAGVCLGLQCVETAVEICFNDKDDDCDGLVDETGAAGCGVFFKDADGDGYGNDKKPTLCLCGPDVSLEYTSEQGGDCNDSDPSVNPDGTEACNLKDDDCDGNVDLPGSLGCDKRYKDADEDGYGLLDDWLCVCADAPPYTAAAPGDCDDADDTVHPGATEACNGKDNNCDGLPPPPDLAGCKTYNEDADQDGYGKTATLKCLCEPQGLYNTQTGGDCDDLKASVNPGATENCATAWDDNCDSQPDALGALGCTEFALDADLDGYGASETQCWCGAHAPYTALVKGDCNDSDATVHPGTKICGVDADCDGSYADVGEPCDDGNSVNWDGCNTCAIVEFMANSYTAGNQSSAVSLAFSDGRYAVVWASDAQDGSGLGIFSQRFKSDGSKDGAESQINSYTSGEQSSPASVVLAGDKLLVVWHSYLQDGASWGVYGQLFNADGTKDGSEFQVNTTTASNQSSPTAASLGDGAFMVAWHSGSQDGSGNGVFFQRFAADGTKSGSETQANTWYSNDQSFPVAARLPDGKFALFWQSYGQDGSNWGVFGQRFKADGSKDGFEFLVNATAADVQSTPAVSAFGDGSLVVAWKSFGQDGSLLGVVAQRYKADGTKDGGEFVANSFTANDQSAASVATLASGAFVIAWQSALQDASAEGVYGQRFKSDGTKDGSEFSINGYTTSYQQRPSLAAFSDGRFLVSWTSGGQDGSSGGIYAVRFGTDGKKIYK